jgi:hypothetical protein
VIDRAAEAAWPEEVRGAVAPFLQGDLIETPPFFYAADLRAPVWGLTHVVSADTAEQERGEELLELDQGDRPPYGIITTQSCDLAEETDRPRKPWIAVAPVYSVSDDSPSLHRDEIYRLNPVGLPEGAALVADLRIEMPLEKSVLVGRQPIRAFATEQEAVAFGNYLARRRGRPALASVFHDVITQAMQDLRNESNARKSQRRRVRERVYQVRLAIEEGTRLQPTAAKLWVVCVGEPEGVTPDPETRDWFGAWFDRARPIAERAGLQLHPVGYLDARSVDVVLYDDLIEIANPLG